MTLADILFVAAIVIGVVGTGHCLLVKKWIPQDINKAIHKYVQYMYDNGMLSKKGIAEMRRDVKTGQYIWKL